MKNDTIEMVIDWFQLTIFPTSDFIKNSSLISGFPSNDKILVYLFYFLFGINSSDVVLDDHAVNGYNVSYSYKNIVIMNNYQRPDMGINILLKGSGCRDFEDLNIGGWKLLFQKLTKFDINFNRIDIAIDTFTNKYFDFNLLKRYIDKGLCVSKFKRTFNMYQVRLCDGSIASNTIQFGSKASDIEITFYDKLMERNNAGFILDNNIDFWIRTELRFRHENALSIFNTINKDDFYSNYIFEVLYNYIDFKTFRSSDSNIRRRPTATFWSDFISSNKKIQLSRRSRERDISRIYNWLLTDTSKSNLMVYFSTLPNIKLDTLSIDLIYNLLLSGSKNIKDKDIQLINDYRINNSLVPFSKEQLFDYIQDMKDNILE